MACFLGWNSRWGLVNVILGVLACLFATPLRAQAPPIRGEGGLTEFFQGQAFRTFSRIVVRDEILKDGEEQPNPQQMRVVVYVQPFVFNLAPASNLNLAIVAPIVVKRFHDVLQPGLRTTAGFGDLSLMGKYRFWKKLGPETRSDAAVLVGVKLPTGSTGARDSGGNRLPIPAQIGTGSTDAFIQGSWSFQESGRGYGLFADLRYTAKTEGRGYSFGDTLELDGGLSKRLYPRLYTEIKPVEFYAELSFLYAHAERDRNLGSHIPSSGGDSVFWAPGLTGIIKQRVLLEVSFEFPITQRLNGTQLAQGWNVLFGTRIIY